MKPAYKIAGALIVLFVLFVMSIADIPYLSVKLVPEAHALRGRGAAFAIGAAAGSARSSSAEAEAAAAQQQAAAAQQQAAAAEQQLAAEKEKTAAAQKEAAEAKQAAAAGGALPLGTVVAHLPEGCKPVPSGGVTYYHCGGNVYQAAYEGSTLKYVTTKPK
jgi:hypothetical protein